MASRCRCVWLARGGVAGTERPQASIPKGVAVRPSAGSTDRHHHIRQSEPSTVDDDIDTSSKHQALAVTPKGGGGGKGRGKGDRKRPRAKSDDKPPGDDIAERTCTECDTKFKPQMTYHKYCTKCQAERNKKLRPSKKTEADQEKTAPTASPKPKAAKRSAPTDTLVYILFVKRSNVLLLCMATACPHQHRQFTKRSKTV